MADYPKKDYDISERVAQFLRDSSEYFCDKVNDKVKALRMVAGDFWTDELKAEWHRDRRRCEHLSQWPVFEAAIASPLSSSPWHAQLNDGFPEIQDKVNAIEADSDAKNAILNAFSSAVDCGVGYVVLTTITDDVTGETRIVPEFVRDVGAIALDPCIVTASGRDAEQGAVVNWMPVKKARRLYGDDVVPLNWPETDTILSSIGSQWGERPKHTIPHVTFYEKNEAGTVDVYKLCGEKVVDKVTLPTRTIPIFRFAGYPVFKTNDVDYCGIVQRTYSLQLGLNIAYSTMLERANRSPKAGWMMPVGAMEGLEDYFRRAQDDDSLAVMYNVVDGQAPQQMRESFETADLKNIIDTTQQLMAAVLGVPVTGIQAGERTATEILDQAANRENNVATLYNNAYEAIKAMWGCAVEMLNGGSPLSFSLQAGPDVITANMKRRQEIAVIAELVPDTMKPVLAKYYADSLTTDYAKMLSADIVANLDPAVKLVSNNDIDPYAVHELKQMKAVCEQTMEQLETVTEENATLKEQVNSMLVELANKREQREQDWNKFILENNLKQKQLELQAQKEGTNSGIAQQKADAETQKANIEAEMAMAELVDTNNVTLEDANGTV